MKPIAIVLAALLTLLACKKGQDKTAYPVFGINPIESTSLYNELPDALRQWTAMGIQDAVLVYVGREMGFKQIEKDKLEKLEGLVVNGRYENILPSSGFFGKDDYLYAAYRLGVFNRIYWVLPYQFVNLSTAKIGMMELLKGNGFDLEEILKMDVKHGCLTGRLRDAEVSVCGPQSLPKVDGMAVIAIDLGALPVMAEEYGLSNLSAMKMLYDSLEMRSLSVRHASIAYGATKGFLKPIYIYLGQELMDAMRNPEIMHRPDPPDIWKIRDEIDNMLTGGEDKLVLDSLKEPLKLHPEDKALRMFKAIAGALTGDSDSAYVMLEALCKEDASYCMGFAYLGKVINENGKHKEGERFLQRAVDIMPENDFVRKLYEQYLSNANQKQ